MIGTYTSYRSVINNMEKVTANVMKQPIVKRETDYYRQNIASVRTVDEFLKNDRLYNYAIKAWGLGEMGFAKGMIKKVLTDPDFAFGLIDKRYREFAKAFDFNKNGAETTSGELATHATVNKYMQQTLEESAGESNEGTRLALYFTRTIGSMVQKGDLSKEDWAYQLISDKALRQVVFTALAIPEQVGASDVDAQKRMLENRISYATLADPRKLEKFIGQFSAMYDRQNTTPTDAALTLLQSGAQTMIGGFSSSSLAALQNLKLGAR